MPFCDNCDRFLNPNSLDATGGCPTCHSAVADTGGGHVATRAPWHFKLLVAAVSAYLGWRFVQLLQWLF